MRKTANLLHLAVCGWILLAASPGSAWGFQATQSADVPGTTTTSPAPITLPDGAVALTATVTSVKGIVSVRAGENAAWEPAKPGMKLDQGAEIRTGLRSAVQFVVGNDETITLDRLGTCTLLQAFQNRGRAKTDLGLKYGRARYDIQATDLQHESTIRSPGSTLAIRGTDIVYEDQAPWVPQAVSREGRAQFRNFRRQFVAFGGQKRATIAADKNSPAQQALSNTKADPKGQFAGRTDSEDELTLTLNSTGGFDTQSLQAFQDLARGFASGPDAGFTGIPPLPGPLEFSLTWFDASGGSSPVNLDLTVTDPLGNTASALNPVVGSGSATGMHGGGNVGSSGLGTETVSWLQFFPPGIYTVRVTHEGGADAQISSVTATQSENIVIIKDFAPTPITLSPGGSFTDTVTTQTNPTPPASANQRAARSAPLRASRLANVRSSGPLHGTGPVSARKR
jgi:hypothetical protein